MPISRPLVATATVAGVGTFGWVAFRMYVRSRVVDTLNTKYRYDQTVAALGPLKMALKLPSASELSESLVPVWSTAMPDAALNDILKRGRRSEFWPQGYKTGAVSASVEPYVLNILRKGVSDKKSPEAVALQIVGTLTQSLTK